MELLTHRLRNTSEKPLSFFHSDFVQKFIQVLVNKGLQQEISHSFHLFIKSGMNSRTEKKCSFCRVIFVQPSWNYSVGQTQKRLQLKQNRNDQIVRNSLHKKWQIFIQYFWSHFRKINLIVNRSAVAVLYLSPNIDQTGISSKITVLVC